MAAHRANPVDVLVIGGGVNGAGIARDAAGRGLSVLLCEQNDLASGTSSASTKLIHGGLRYLEHYEFRLVREALVEREVLLRAAPHIIRPLRFVLPHNRHMRPAWLIRLGLFLYDHLGGRELLPGSRTLDLRSDPAGAPLDPRFTRAFEYSDCWVDDARLVVLTAVDAGERGATILSRTRCAGACRENGLWRVRLASTDGGAKEGAKRGAEDEVWARSVVNAAGPWVVDVLDGKLGRDTRHAVRLVKGSHIVVPRLFEGPQAYLFQSADRRVVFAIPYEAAYTLIGTTDVEYSGDPAEAAIDGEEVAYLCGVASSYLARPVTPDRIVWSYSGVRPLRDDGAADAAALSRDYVLDLDAPAGEAPLLSVFGGKVTTFRRLAEQAVDLLQRPLGAAGAPWTAGTVLPGGDLP
ncbi:MAG TPA: glycerol-3-phosphate dehydrogenase, partial [Alphaproteobacteria bacterium]|nr:glycerol-3-phosphate dehydrogenase [Alphaproteobacteria bacterium]